MRIPRFEVECLRDPGTVGVSCVEHSAESSEGEWVLGRVMLRDIRRGSG